MEQDKRKGAAAWNSFLAGLPIPSLGYSESFTLLLFTFRGKDYLYHWQTAVDRSGYERLSADREVSAEVWCCFIFPL